VSVMTMIYSNPARENEAGALPDVEVFEATSANSLSRADFDYSAECGYVVCQDCRKPLYPMETEDGTSNCCGAPALAMGWYWQRQPVGEPNGPFDTEAETIADAQSDSLNTDSEGNVLDDDALPPCVLAMRCYCAGHARGNAASEPCDTNEQGEVRS